MRRFLPFLLLLTACSGEDPIDTGTPDAGTAGTADAGTADAGPSTDGGEDPVDAGPTLDDQLAEVLGQLTTAVTPLTPPPPAMPAVYDLGQALFFDPILSGNKDVACASCHHPNQATSDNLHLAVGTGAMGLGAERSEPGHPPFVPRHSIDLFNRGDASWTKLFWDGRVEEDAQGDLQGPAPIPAGVDNVLAAQALIPILDRREMRGMMGEMAVDGTTNELGNIADNDPTAIWSAIVARLIAIPEYEMMFLAAFPELGTDPPTIVNVVNAIAAFEAEAFAATDTPWDEYLRGNLDAINDAQKLGAIIFYGSADCGRCHAGPLFTDQKFHNTGIPQIGPGTGVAAPLDYGRENVSGVGADRYAFRTPPLRNVMRTAPYMHNGVLVDMDAVMRHYAEPEGTVGRVDPADLHPDLRATIQTDATHVMELHSLLSADLNMATDGRTFVGLSNIRQFLRGLNDDGFDDLGAVIPANVPSGLTLP